ncbi:MAG TPA: hypothetical protein VJP07_07030 [Dehalococcoidia bacterium]|nr:hypothetical protein [Dehalococcoidia bacterium]
MVEDGGLADPALSVLDRELFRRLGWPWLGYAKRRERGVHRHGGIGWMRA